MHDAVTLDLFRPAVGDAFALHADGGVRVELELVEAQAYASGAAATGRERFRLAFAGPVAPVLPQRMYRLEHDRLGVLEIFIVPVGRDAAGTTYEAVFA
jgi:hypothetical protein